MLLDSNILIWATIPTCILVFCGVLLRSLIQTTNQTRKRRATISGETNININDNLLSNQRSKLRNSEYQQHLNRSVLLRTKGFLLSKDSLKRRSLFYTHKDHGYFRKGPPAPNPLAAFSNPDHSALSGMMKNQFGFLILNGGMGFLVSSLFSGFIVAKFPFPLAFSFKGMLQRGISFIPNLDPSFLSALSFYFIVLLGSNGIITLLFYYFNFNQTGIMSIDFPSMNPQVQTNNLMANQIDYSKLFKEEIDSWSITNEESILDVIEDKLLLNELP
ncbi:hypothetical protein cand_023580 [Cryptosporidium andersoni]|uniref:ER membrane protein complex subunit 3 n=1 Tax=Cryptosporidium andersoni TaxID=117008 RepID=A0A1J4MSG8_9CRYT|nr:hypothetical protein cand_023580 [Cryptosporidium andersoni]